MDVNIHNIKKIKEKIVKHHENKEYCFYVKTITVETTENEIIKIDLFSTDKKIWKKLF